MSLHSDFECFETAEDKECFLWTKNRTCHVFNAEHSNLAYEVCFTGHETSDNVAMTVEVFCCGVNNNVSTESKWALEVWRSKCVVADNFDFWVVCVCCFCYCCDVSNFKVRVSWCFKVYSNCVFFESCFNCIDVSCVYKVNFNAVSCETVAEKSKCTAVECAVSNDVCASFCDCPECGGDSAHTGRCSKCCFCAVESCDFCFKNGSCWVAKTGVDVTSFLAGESCSALFAGIEYECRCLIDRHCQCAVLFVMNIASVNTFCAKTFVCVIHNNAPFVI